MEMRLARLDAIRRMKLAVDGLRAKKQVRKRRAIDGLDLGFGPIKAQ